MTQSKAEIKAIQAKLQAIQAGRSSARPSPVLSPMVELTPKRVTNPDQETMPQPSPESPKTIATVLNQRATAYVQQLQQTGPQPQQTIPVAKPQVKSQDASQDKVAAIGRLEAQAQRINALSIAQEAAMLELKAIAERLERDWRASEITQQPHLGGEDVPLICQYLTTAVPHIEKDKDGSYVLTLRDIDLFRAEREATFNAHKLRQGTPQPLSRNKTRHPHSHRHSSSGIHSQIESFSQLLRKSLGGVVRSLTLPKSHPPSLKTARSQAAHASELPDFSMQDAILWVLGAIVVRVGLDLLLIAHPGLWLPVVGLIVTPAAIAVYQATVAPQSGFVWGYRLLLIMIGLLIGGRL